MKKKLFAFMAFLGLAMTSVFVSPMVESNAAYTSKNDVMSQSAVLPGCNISQQDWDSYIGETELIARTSIPERLKNDPEFSGPGNYYITNENHNWIYGKNYIVGDESGLEIKGDTTEEFSLYDYVEDDSYINRDNYYILLFFHDDAAHNYEFSYCLFDSGAIFLEISIYNSYDFSEWVFDGRVENIAAKGEVIAAAVPINVFSRKNLFEKQYAQYAFPIYVAWDADITDAPDLQAPTVGIPANYIVNVDNMQSHDQILSHVTVIDDTDPNPRLVVKSTNYSQSNRVIGTYQFVVYGIDANGNTSAEYTFNVIVADSTKPSNTTFGTITQNNNVQLSPDQIISKFTISDNYSSSQNITKVLVKNDYSSNWTKPGRYEVVCRATDESGNFQDSTGYINVVDKTAPSNQGRTITQPNNVKLSNAELLALFTVSDDVSAAGKITKSVLTDSYSNNFNVPGRYEVVCRATDEAGNYTDSTSVINVEDKTKPTISGKTIDVLYNSKLEDLKSLFTYSDDVSSRENIVFEIISDGYTTTFNRKGSHTVTAKITDEAGNNQEASALVRVVDTIKPVITAPTEITIGNSTRFTDEQLKQKIVVEDEYDGVIAEYTITDNNDYNNNYLIVGRYTKTITASDEEGNTQSLTITYIIIDDTSPQIFYDKYMIVLTEGESLTEEMIKAYAAQALGVAEAAILFIDGDYDVEVVGTYEVSLCMMDGTVQPFTISVGELVEKEPVKWTAKSFFSSNIDNWNQFDQWPAWSICTWLIWCGIGIAAAVAVAVVSRIVIKRAKNALKI